MLTLQTTATPQPAVLVIALRAELVLLSLTTQSYYTLNESGAQIWRALGDGLSIAEIGDLLQQRYAVSPAHAQQSVIALLTELLAEGLVTIP